MSNMLEQAIIDAATLREAALKNAESTKQDPMLIMKKIEELQVQKKTPLHQNATGK